MEAVDDILPPCFYDEIVVRLHATSLESECNIRTKKILKIFLIYINLGTNNIIRSSRYHHLH